MFYSILRFFVIIVFLLSFKISFGQKSQILGIWQTKFKNGKPVSGKDLGGGPSLSDYNVYFVFTSNSVYLAFSKAPSFINQTNLQTTNKNVFSTITNYVIYKDIENIPLSKRSYYYQLKPGDKDNLFIDCNFNSVASFYFLYDSSKQFRGIEDSNSEMVLNRVGSFDSDEEASVRRAEEEAESQRLAAIEREQQISNKLVEANSAFDKKNFSQALYYYEEVLKLNPNNQESRQKKDELSLFISKRMGAGFSFREENPSEYQQLLDKLKFIIQEESTSSDKGDLTLDILIEFDTNGINLSRVTNSQNENLSSKIRQLLTSGLISPTLKYGVFINSKELVQIKSIWSLLSEEVISNAKGINGVGSAFQSKPQDYKNFIQSQKYPYGKFYFNSKDNLVDINGKKDTLSSIFLTRYKLNSGPQHAFLSLLFPGWGSHKVSNGNNGFLTSLLAVVALGTSGLSKIMEKIEMGKYTKAESQNDAESSYESANNSRKLFVISLGVAGLTYVYDFSWSFVKGFSNIKKSKYYRVNLKKGPIKVK
jgi:uncharacterized protein Smg (DUF494 family)